MEFKEIAQSRYATKKFDGKEVPQDKINELQELIRLSASSFGLQPWKVKVVTDSETKQKLLGASWNQEQVTSCSHLLVFCADTDVKSRIEEYEKMMLDQGTPQEKVEAYTGIMKGFMEGQTPEHTLAWAQRQTYIAMGNALNGAKSLGLDSCPMEGFVSEEYAKILELPNHLVPTVLVPVGYAADTPRDKLRYPKERLFI